MPSLISKTRRTTSAGMEISVDLAFLSALVLTGAACLFDNLFGPGASGRMRRSRHGRFYLAEGADSRKGVELGKLSRFSGQVEYDIPAGVNPEAYDSAVI